MKSRRVRGHIASFEEDVRGTVEFRALQIFKNKSENSKFVYSIFSEVIGYIELPVCLYLIPH